MQNISSEEHGRFHAVQSPPTTSAVCGAKIEPRNQILVGTHEESVRS
jgi:hypothetical protein